jgi:hypothetical protein
MADWVSKKLKELGVMRGAGADKLTQPGEKPIRLVNYMDVYTNHRITNAMTFQEVTATDREIAECDLKRGDVLVETLLPHALDSPDTNRHVLSQGQQALAASCRDCSAGWLPQEHTRVFWCRDCTEAFRQGRQAPAVSCMDCTAVWLLSERIRIAWCTDYIAAAPSPPPNLEDIEKAQMRTRAWHGTRFTAPLS